MLDLCSKMLIFTRLSLPVRQPHIKSQPYSLQHMLNNEPIAESFVGGTVYQNFLTIREYHRWHVPVDGTIQKAYVAEGSYYAQALSVGYSLTFDSSTSVM